MQRFEIKYYLIAGLTAVLCFYFLFLPAKFLILDNNLKQFILKRQSNPLQYNTKDLLVINIDEETLRSYKVQAPIGRKFLALLLARLKEARLIMLTFPVMGASGTSGDSALLKVLKSQHNIVFPVRFSGIMPSLTGIVSANDVFWLPWKAVLPFVMVGSVDFYTDERGRVQGFYPFFSYKGNVVPHMVIRALGDYLSRDIMNFSVSPKTREISWDSPDSQGNFRLPLDLKGGFDITRPLSDINRINAISVSDILPPRLFFHYRHRGVKIPASEKVKGKFCIVGYKGPFGVYYTDGNGSQVPLQELLYKAFAGIRQGQVFRFVPLVGQFFAFLLFLFALIFAARRSYQLMFGIFILIASLIGYSFYFAIQHNTFFMGIEMLAAVFIAFLLLVVARWRVEQITSSARNLEKYIVKEIKEKTTYLPPYVDWMDIRIRESYGQEIGGSMYDFVDVGQDKLALVVADVMDLGKSALTKLSYLRGLLRSHSIITHQPGEVVYSVNKALVRGKVVNMSAKFLYVLLDAPNNRLFFSGAGGLSFVVLDRLRKQVKCYEVEERIPLGISREIYYEPREIKIAKGDIVLFYTPSIFNVRNKEGRSYDIDRLGKLLLASAKLPMQALVDKLALDIKSFAAFLPEDFAVIGILWKKEDVLVDEELSVGVSKVERDMLLFYSNMKKGGNRRLRKEI